jgi:hypothetical protein
MQGHEAAEQDEPFEIQNVFWQRPLLSFDQTFVDRPVRRWTAHLKRRKGKVREILTLPSHLSSHLLHARKLFVSMRTGDRCAYNSGICNKGAGELEMVGSTSHSKRGK